MLEAALSGCALVLGDIPSLRELWDGAAVFVEPDEGEALQAELRALCADRARLASLGNLALARSRSFSSVRMTAGYLAVYRELMSVYRYRPCWSMEGTNKAGQGASAPVAGPRVLMSTDPL